MKVALYARVSTDEQNTENQIPLLEVWVKSRGWVLSGIYQEEASAWRAGHQKELARLFVDARKQNFDLVVVWALDRLTREGPLKTLVLIKKLAEYKVRVVSYQEPWMELPGPAQELLLCIAAWIAKSESERRSERTLAGLERIKKYGSKTGTPVGIRGPDKKPRKKRAPKTADGFSGILGIELG